MLLTLIDGCPAISNDHFATLPGVAFDWPETKIGSAVPYPCPCRNILGLDESSGKKNGLRKCGGTYTHGAMWEPINIIEDCGLSDIVIKLCQAKLVSMLCNVMCNVMFSSLHVRICSIIADVIFVNNNIYYGCRSTTLKVLQKPW